MAIFDVKHETFESINCLQEEMSRLEDEVSACHIGDYLSLALIPRDCINVMHTNKTWW